ncbi:MAG: tetratricopeptide repeat protein [Nitrospirota bacterium]
MNSVTRLLQTSLWPLGLLAAVLYVPFLAHPFQYDDTHTIVENSALHQPDAWRAALTGTLHSSGEVQGGHYRPLTYLSYWLTIQLAGLAPAAFQGVNLVLHLLTAWLLMILVKDVTADRRVAVLTGAVFALHPAVSEAVLYTSARATLLSCLFISTSLVCYVRARRESGIGWWTGWAGFGVAAVLSKESGVVLPLLCAAIDPLVIPRNAPPGRWARWGPHAAAWGALAAFTARLGLWQHAAATWAAPDALAQYVGAVANQIAAIGLAIRLFLVPWPLTVDHLLPTWPDPAAVGLAALAGLCAAAGAVGLASQRPAIQRAGFWALWVVIIALPTTLWPLNVSFQEHRAYLQHAGLAALAASGLVRLWDAGALKPRVAAALAAVIVTAWGWLIVEQGRTWSDPVRLWDHARRVAPASFRAHTNAGLALAAANRWEDASTALSSALSLNPDYPPALAARGVAAQRLGRLDRARADYERAASLRPDYVPALFNLGLLTQTANEPGPAEQWYRRALAVNPLHHDSLLNLSALLITQGRINEADPLLSTARRVSPRSPEALYYSGVIAEQRGGDARRLYRAAVDAARAAGKTALADDAQARLATLQADGPRGDGPR